MRRKAADDARWDDYRAWRGRCYEAAARFMLDSRRRGKDWRLCHGIPLGRGGRVKDRRYGHAWVEHGDTVYDLTFPNGHEGFPRDLYYLLGNIDPSEILRYDWDSMCAWLVNKQNYGPWEPEAKPKRKRKRRTLCSRKEPS